MKLILPDALHARPANLLVRAASQLTAVVTVIRGDKRANAADILQVLSLGAAKGEEIELASEDAAAVHVLARLIQEEFDPDLVPENGAVAAAGIAIGEAIVLLEEEADLRARGTDDEEIARALGAFAKARDDVGAMVGALPKHEAQLFEPELLILQSLEPMVLSQIAGGATAEDAVRAEAVPGPSDLIDDARRRLLDALAGSTGVRAKRLAESAGREVVLVVEGVTPSLVASVPDHVIGIIAASEDESTGTTSHAAILARGRGLPLAYVPTHVAFAIEDGVLVILDTTEAPARIWSSPSAELVAEVRARRDALHTAERDAAAAAREPLSIVAVRTNIGSPRDAVPEGAEGIGLLRSELVFADRIAAPTEEEQYAAYSAIARKTSGPVYVRLFDAGGDKPLPFLPSNTPDERGVALLRAHQAVLATQLRAIGRARDAGDVRVLIPLVRDAADVHAIRAEAPAGVLVGAMIETPAAADDIDAIAEAADFICIGTNDLASETLGLAREEAPDPLDPRVLRHVLRTVEGAHARERKVTVCGEVAADVRGAKILIGLGVDALSVSPKRFAGLKLGLRETLADDCKKAAREALGSPS
jgi:multiphosphoryl transfer protein